MADLAGSPGYIFLAPRPLSSTAEPQSGPMIIDFNGDLIWFSPSIHPAVFNLTPQLYRGQPVVTWWSGVTGPTYGQGSYTVADATYRTIATIPGARGIPGDLHEFVISNEDTALFTAYGQTGSDGQALVQGFAFEVDVATNDLVFEWSSDGPGGVPVTESYQPPPSPTSAPWDYFHINSVDLWPGSGRDLLISARNTCTIYRVDRRSGQIVWRLGGKRSDFALTKRTRFWWQHDARALPDGSGLSLFDDASNPDERSQGDAQSRGMVLKFGAGGKSLVLERQVFHTDTGTSGNEAGFMGSMQLLPSGGSFVGWGGQMPFFSAFVSSGDSASAPLVFDGRLPPAWFSYRAYTAGWVGSPSVIEIALVVRPEPTASDRWHAYVSWNGATEVQSWRLWAGESPGELRQQKVLTRTGFETDVVVSAARRSGSGTPFFRADALDGAGKLLGTSSVVSAVA